MGPFPEVSSPLISQIQSLGDSVAVKEVCLHRAAARCEGRRVGPHGGSWFLTRGTGNSSRVCAWAYLIREKFQQVTYSLCASVSFSVKGSTVRAAEGEGAQVTPRTPSNPPPLPIWSSRHSWL